ncbi:MAG: serine hydrolase [Gammaproteobacteria bacterium]|nr:serine hydrolase [Gammaproteobacteria bacterium]MDG2339124.1 serine hydrolase [Gammaproteobacteria bacterium]
MDIKPLRNLSFALVYLFAALTVSLASAQDIPWASSAEEVGVSSERLERINQAMQRHIDAGNIQGAVTAVARRGKLVHFQTHGAMDVPNKRPMTDDSLFIMMSSTKPVLGVAAMMMIEEGLIRPTDPVSKWIPEFEDMQVAVLAAPFDENISPLRVDPEDLPEYRLVPAHRQITVHDILTHTSGLASSGLGSAISAPADRSPGATLANTVPKFGDYVLDFQPGTRWQYSPATALDVIARIIEIESGMPFPQFTQQRIFEPLGMNNTWWNVPAEYQDRRVVIVDRDMSRFFDVPDTTYFSGSYGLNSTAEDYLRFEQMLANGGELFGNRLLSPRTVRMMASNQSGDLYKGIGRNLRGQGFGYTVAVAEDPIVSNTRRSPGAFGWGGAFGTRSYTDPEEELTAVIMLQQPYRAAQEDFENAVQQAIID